MLAQVLGDRSLKLKYLNPNTMFLATGSSPAHPGKAHITAHIFDTITGRLLFSQTHEVTPSATHIGSRAEELWLICGSLLGADSGHDKLPISCSELSLDAMLQGEVH